METLDLEPALEKFETLFAAAQRTMFKAEVLQDYSAVDHSPSLLAWLGGNTALARSLGESDRDTTAWRQQCLNSPAAITRVHVVDEPLTPYLEWEIAVIYGDSLVPSGAETVYLAPSQKLPDITLPAGDFWIFDDEQVLQWSYQAETGELASARVWGKGDDITPFLELREKFLAASTPVSATPAAGS